MRFQVWEYLLRKVWRRNVLLFVTGLWVLYLTGLIYVLWMTYLLAAAFGIGLGLTRRQRAWEEGAWGGVIGFGTLHLWYSMADLIKRTIGQEPITWVSILDLQGACFLRLIFPTLGSLAAGIGIGIIARRRWAQFRAKGPGP